MPDVLTPKPSSHEVTGVEKRQCNRLPSKKPGSLVVKRDYEHEERFACLIIDASPPGFRVRVNIRLRCGQVVEVIIDDDPLSAVRCQVVWVGMPGSKEQGTVGLKLVSSNRADPAA